MNVNIITKYKTNQIYIVEIQYSDYYNRTYGGEVLKL